MNEQPTPAQLRTVAAALGRSYPSVRQYADVVRAAASRIEELERLALLGRFEARAPKGRKRSA